MANHVSALKRAKQNTIKRARNRSIRTVVKNHIKAIHLAIEKKDVNEAQTCLSNAIPVINKASSKGVFHKRNASRKISRLTRHVNALAS